MNTGRYNLIELLNNNEIDQIIIPEIQRDYVWKEENVISLLESIWSNFKEKKSIQLNIKDGEDHVDENMKEFLSKEYSKIRHATQIGFIYAYHDVEYVRECRKVLSYRWSATDNYSILVIIGTL